MILLTAAPVVSNAAPLDNEKLAEQAVNSYVTAIQQGNIDEAIKWVIDTRFSSTEEQKKSYEENNDLFSKVTVEVVSDPENNSFAAKIDLTRRDDGTINEVSLPVIQQDGAWKVLLNGEQETKSSLVKTQYFSKEDSNVISPMASVLVGNYEYYLSPGKATYTGSFNMVSLAVGISGWQHNPGSTKSVTGKYQVVSQGAFSDDVKGESFVTGYYPPSGSAFYTTIRIVSTTTPPQGVKVKAIDPSSQDGLDVKGYVYS
uniref:Predicted protein n=1 Tax=Physcomitrium patens TaxID=3218 RepID=A9U7N8_PHYPA